MVAVENKARFLAPARGPDSLNSPLFLKNILLEQRITLLEQLAKCANEIKRIDEQIKLI